MSNLGEKQSMQRADLPEPSAQWVVLHLSDFPERIPCGVFHFIEGLCCPGLIHFSIHRWNISINFPTSWFRLHKRGKKKRFRFESMGGAFYKQLHQWFVPKDVNNLFFKKWKTTGCISGVPLTAKHSLVNTQANGPLYPDVSEPVCGPIHMWSLSWRK